MCFWKNCFARFFPPFFWSRYSCEYKKTFFSLFPDDFSPTYFARTTRVFLEKLFRAFFPPFFGNDNRVNIKKLFSHFFPTIFSPTFFARTIRVFLEKLFRAFFTHPIFWSRYSCEYKKTFFALFSDDFFPNIFCSHY